MFEMTLNDKLNAIRDGIEYLIDSQYVTWEIQNQVDSGGSEIVFYESDKYKDHWYLDISSVNDIMWCIVYLSTYFKFGTYPGDD